MLSSNHRSYRRRCSTLSVVCIVNQRAVHSLVNARRDLINTELEKSNLSAHRMWTSARTGYPGTRFNTRWD